jgi:hypothetical protein
MPDTTVPSARSNVPLRCRYCGKLFVPEHSQQEVHPGCFPAYVRERTNGDRREEQHQ